MTSHPKSRFPSVLTPAAIAITMIWLLLTLLHFDLSTRFITNFDRQIQAFAHVHSSEYVTQLMLAFTFLGSVKVFVSLVAIIACVLWVRALRHDAALLVIAMTTAGILNTTFKLHFHRVRPQVPWAIGSESSFSFPSGHTVFAIVLYGVLCYLPLLRIRNPLARLAVSFAALAIIVAIGFSRIYLGMHYPSDVAAGCIEGSLWLLAVLVTDRSLRPAGLLPSPE